jgi:PAS domain S-box-containing protein/putative nucleotidyltransferase with HDIG domain
MNHKAPKVGHQWPKEKQKKSETTYRDLANSLPQTVAEIDIEGNIIFTNLISFTMFGYAKEDFDKGLNIFQMIAPDDHERAKDNIQKYLRGQKPISGEYTGIRKNGSRFPLKVYLNPVLDEGKTVGFRAIVIDITESKRSEEALLTSQRQLSEATDLAKIVYWEVDPTDNVFSFNDSFYAFYGTTAEQEGGYRMTREEFSKRFVHPDDLQLVRRFMEKNTTITGAGSSSDLEHRIIRRDGEVRHILVRASVVNDDSGRIVKRYGANQDITDRNKMAEALQESGEQFEKLFMESPLGMVIVGADFLFIRANAAFCRMSGYTEKELTSLTFKDLTYPAQIAKDISALNNLLSGKAALYRTEKQYIRKDKGVAWGSLTVNAIRDRDNRFLHFFTTVEDITVRKQSEEALNQSLKKLRRNLMGTIQAMSSMVEIRDPYTAGHEKIVSMLARAIANELGLPSDVVDNIRMAASIHDIGKIAVPTEILSKPGRLTDIEMSLIQRHSQTGYEILKDVDLPYPIARIVLQHHERLNGSGYPQGIRIGEILLESRIVSVADVVEAMASHRPYRPALGIDIALEEIEKNKGTFYDAVVVDACVRLFREKGFKLE